MITAVKSEKVLAEISFDFLCKTSTTAHIVPILYVNTFNPHVYIYHLLQGRLPTLILQQIKLLWQEFSNGQW